MLEAIGVHGQEPREDVLWRDRSKQSRTAYEAYLASPKWKARRAFMLVVAGGRCELCGSTQILTIHHLVYPEASPRDLVVLCWMDHVGAQDLLPEHPTSVRLRSIAASHPGGEFV